MKILLLTICVFLISMSERTDGFSNEDKYLFGGLCNEVKIKEKNCKTQIEKYWKSIKLLRDTRKLNDESGLQAVNLLKELSEERVPLAKTLYMALHAQSMDLDAKGLKNDPMYLNHKKYPPFYEGVITRSASEKKLIEKRQAVRDSYDFSLLHPFESNFGYIGRHLLENDSSACLIFSVVYAKNISDLNRDEISIREWVNHDELKVHLFYAAKYVSFFRNYRYEDEIPERTFVNLNIVKDMGSKTAEELVEKFYLEYPDFLNSPQREELLKKNVCE